MEASQTTRISYCMVCASVWRDNPRASASGLSPYRRKDHIMTFIAPAYNLHFVHCEIFDVTHWNITKGAIS